jgi:hypothetical protein
MAPTTRTKYSQFQQASESSSSADNPSSLARWRAPMFISVSLAAAIILAVGHHYMGLSLADKPVDKISVSQAWIFRFSAALRQDRFDRRSRHSLCAAAVLAIPAHHFHIDRRRRFDGCSWKRFQLLRNRYLVCKSETHPHRTGIDVSIEARTLMLDSLLTAAETWQSSRSFRPGS